LKVQTSIIHSRKSQWKTRNDC